MSLNRSPAFLILGAARLLGGLAFTSRAPATDFVSDASAPRPTLGDELPRATQEQVAQVSYCHGSPRRADHRHRAQRLRLSLLRGMFALVTYPELHHEFVETGKVRWHYVPFVMGMFPNGTEAARAAECAAEQGIRPSGPCMTSSMRGNRITAAKVFARQAGVHATPTFIVNGRRIQGALPL